MNSKDARDMSYKSRKKNHRTPNYTYQRNPGYYSGNRNYSYNNCYSNNGTSAGSSKNAFNSRSTRQYYHSRKDSFEYFKDYHWQQPRIAKREPSPLNGSEEYTLRKIQETSDMIKRQLMSPDNTPAELNSRIDPEPSNKSPKVMKKYKKRNYKEPSTAKRKLERKAALREKFKKNVSVQKLSDTTYNVKEIHEQIMNHISKLNYGRKQNLVNADSTGYDAALQHIYKQKSLELSKALREMSHQQKPEASEIVNSIIPDFAIKFEELPVHVIRELSSTFEAIEKNIGNDSGASPFDFLKYSSMNECGFNSTPLQQDNSFFQQYSESCHDFEIASYINLSDTQNSIDDRVLHVNSEDANSLVIKTENLIESKIKLETMETIVIEDDESNGAEKQEGRHKACPENSNISQSFSDDIIPNIKMTTIKTETAVASEENLTTSEAGNAISSDGNSVVGTLRVSTNIFEKPNQQISIHNGSENELIENFDEDCTYITAQGNSNNLVPKIRVNMNIFNKVGNFSSELHSSTQNDNTVGQYKSGDQVTDKTISPEQWPNNTEILKVSTNNNICFENEKSPESYLNTSRNSNMISSNLCQVKESCNKRSRISIPNQQTEPLLENINDQNQTENQNYNSTNTSKDYCTNESVIRVSSIENGNATACTNNDNPLQTNANNSHEDSRCETNLFPAEIVAEASNKYFSVTIKQFERPKNITDAAKIMLEIDNEIEKLTKLRQSLILNLIDENSVRPIFGDQNEFRRPTSKRKKKSDNIFNAHKSKKLKRNNCKKQNVVPVCSSNDNHENRREKIYDDNIGARIQVEDAVIDGPQKQLVEKCVSKEKTTSSSYYTPITDQSLENTIDLNVNNLPGVPVVLKIVKKENILILGTDEGKVQFFNLCRAEKPVTVGISKNAISCLDVSSIRGKRWVFTGTTTDKRLSIVEFRKNIKKKPILLEDGIQSMQREWEYIFIGGTRGFLTRYNWQKSKIEYEDRISEMSIVDLKATREGARKILIILFMDQQGNKQIHVRDARSALHIRTIGEIQIMNSFLIKDSSLYFSSDQEISVYSFCDGQFIAKHSVPTQRSISLLHKCGNLLMAVSLDGNIYAYNISNMNLLGYFPCDIISSLTSFKDKVIFGLWSKKLKSFKIPENILAFIKTS